MAFEFTPDKTASTAGAIPAVSMEQARTQVLDMRPTSRFYYMHHPENWQLIETDTGWEWLPQLKSFRITPGVNGIRQTRGKNPKPDDRAARMNWIDKGWTFIPYDIIEGGYCWKYPGRRGPVHLDRWAVPKKVGNRTIIKPNLDEYREFLRMLISSGVIEKPDPDVLSLMRETVAQSLDRDGAKMHIPAALARYEENKRRLTGHDEATARMFPPKKKAARKPAKKAEKNVE